MFEKLENRFLMAATANSNGGTVFIDSNAAGDNILVSPGGSQLQVRNNGQVIGNFDIGSINLVIANLGGGNDTLRLTAGASVNLIANGGNGEDLISGGDMGDLINGDGGSDTLNGNGGSDQIFGGAGGDFISGGDGADQLFGNGGNDFLFGDGGSDFLSGGAGYDVADGGDGVDSGDNTNEDANLRPGEDAVEPGEGVAMKEVAAATEM